MKIELKDWDGAEYLQTREDVYLYLQVIFESAHCDGDVLALALADIARSEGLSEIGRETDVSRHLLERLLAQETTPGLATITEALRLLGMRLSTAPTLSLSERNN